MGVFYGKVLVIDNNLKFIDAIKSEDKLVHEFPCLFAKTYLEASQFLKQPKHNIRIIFLSTTIGVSHGVDELKGIKADKPLLPVFLVTHHPEREPKEILANEFGFNKVLRKPKTYSVFTQEIEDLLTSNASWSDTQASKEAKDIEIDLIADNYVPTLLADFILTPKSFFNVYIKLGQSKFIKILNAGDPLQSDLIKSYNEKGVTHLYIAIEEHEKYIRFCSEMSGKSLAHDDIATSKKMHNVLNFGANIAQSLIHTGISEEKLDFANTFLSQSVGLIKAMKMKNESLKKFIDSIEMREHCAAVSFLSGIIANEVGMESIKSIKIVGIAALLHDIGLYDLDPDFKEEELEHFSEEQKKIFDQHQRHGGELLRKCGGFEEVIYQAVEGHHMRRRGSDPSRRSSNVNMVTEIIGAADELHNIVISRHLSDNKINQFAKTNLKNYSLPIEKAILKILQINIAA